MKRRHLLTALVTILLIFTFVACSNNAAAPEDKFGRIIVGDNSRAVGTVVTYSNDVEDLIWFYKATKLDDGYTTGATETLTLVRPLSGSSPQKGLSGQTLAGYFSYGLWTIELAGYKNDNLQNNAPKADASAEYTSKIENLLVDSGVNNATAKIEVGEKAETTIEFGKISFSASNIQESSTFTLTVTDKTNKGTVTVPNSYTETSSSDTTTTVNYPTIEVNNQVGTVTFGGLTYTLADNAEITGEHELDFVLSQKLSGTGNTTIDAALYTLKFTVNKGTKTTISGTLLKNDQTGTVVINSVQDVEPITLSRSIPVDNISVSKNTAKVSEDTTITVGNMIITLPKETVIATTADGLSVDSTGSAGTSDATVGFKSKDSVESGIQVQAGETVQSYELTLPVSTSTTDSEKNNKLVTVKNFIGKGLNVTKVCHAGTAIDAETSEAVPSDNAEGYYYNSESGYLTLYIFHASEFNIITKKVAAKVGGTNYYSFEDAFEAATKDGATDTTITLSDDVSISKALDIKKALTIDLGGKTLNFAVTTSGDGKGAFELADSDSAYTVTVKNGTIKGAMTGSKTNTFTLHKNATLDLDAVVMDVTSFRGIQVYQNTEPATLNISNSTIKVNGAYAVSTEATVAADGSTSKNVTIKIEKSTLETLSSDDDNTALLVNVPSTVTITESTIKGARQGAVLRGGTTTISKSTFSSTGSKTNYYSSGDYLNSNWSSGNEVPLAAIVIGNRNEGYKYPTTVEFKDSNTLTVGENAVRKGLYIYQADKASGDASGVDRSVTVTGTLPAGATFNEGMNGAGVSLTSAKDYYVSGLNNLNSALSSNSDVGTVYLIDDVVLDVKNSKYVTIDKSLTLDGKGHTISNGDLSGTLPLLQIGDRGDNAYTRNIVIENLNVKNTGSVTSDLSSTVRLVNIWNIGTANDNSSVTLKNVNIEMSDSYGSGTYFRGISTDNVHAPITLDNSSVVLPHYYSIFIGGNCANATLNIMNNSTIKGWSTIYNFGSTATDTLGNSSNFTVKAENSSFVSVNHLNKGGKPNSFASVIVSEEKGSNNKMTFTNCMLSAEKEYADSDVTQKIADIRNDGNNEVSFINCELKPAINSKYFMVKWDNNKESTSYSTTNKILVDNVDITKALDERIEWNPILSSN